MLKKNDTLKNEALIHWNQNLNRINEALEAENDKDCEKIIDDLSYGHGDCAYCREYLSSKTDKCSKKCPVYKKTGIVFCGGTPYASFCKNLFNFYRNKNLRNVNKIEDLKCAVEKMIKFLKTT